MAENVYRTAECRLYLLIDCASCSITALRNHPREKNEDDAVCRDGFHHAGQW